MPSKINKSHPAQNLLLLDTCAWIWLIDGHSRIANSKYLARIENAAQNEALFLAPISIWEIATKVSKGKLTLSLPVLEWIRLGKMRSGILDAPLSDEIAAESAFLPGPFHGDPADRLIVATARVLEASLVTGDQAIIKYSQAGFVKTLAI